ncbi:MAG: glycosyltransferase family 4 protein [Desulfobacula sp.]|uniref:glycosyltransferase family 4 protein n=1 Tax=Desulfobacula sp. TaxID=2593537 RepID=UPI0025BFF82B|nr:glycosyltransferase family 4 protein [Desulfobacula sp.]MCD4721464.1 glycosyltransferase family 4 protein [Desulfobacula sp.]
MNILMISLDFPPTVGGISAHVFELAKAIYNHGHSVSIITRKLSSQKTDRFEIEKIKVYSLKLRWIAPLYGWQLNRYIHELLPEIKPDIIHLHGMAPLEGYKVKNIPMVYTNHTSGYLKRIRKGGLRRMALIKRSFKKPDLFLAPSRELLEIPFSINALKHYIPNGVDDQKYIYNPKDRRIIRQQLGVSDHDIIGILTRRLVKKNGVIHLAEAAPYIKNSRLKLLIIGDGPERTSIENLLNRNFKNRFFMLGSKSHDQIIPYYSCADFSILPSLMEATSISGLEAMSVGLPLVGTRVGGIPELIKDGKNGYLCRPADSKDLAEKIDQLTASDLQPFGEISRHRVKTQFAWSQIASQTVTLYNKII